ncbi:NAD(P)-binding Rossmann-fold superfamily protein [Euphorbia peplus]|nr:NAD(P)-binding Rossmann-fold superfamily protein [Euphorbia peplus]
MASSVPSIGVSQASFSFPSHNPSTSSFFFSSGRPPLIRCSAKNKIGFFDQILDYIEGGPKLRKWYGAPQLNPKNNPNSQYQDDFSDEDGVRDTILVTDGDTEVAQMVILSLIVKRAKIKALVKDRRKAMEAFGTYVESIAGDTTDKLLLKKALRGVRAIICPSDGFLSSVGSLKGVNHVILLSQLSVYRGSGGIEALMKSNARKLAEQDESVLMAAGIPYTIIRVGMLENTPGGTQGFNFEKGCAEKGSLSKEDAAFICVEALDIVPQGGFIFEVVNGEEKISNWKDHLAGLMEKAQQ